MIVPFQDEEEAHFVVCALLDSAIARSEVNASISSAAHKDVTHVLLSIPPFSAEIAVHLRLSPVASNV